MSSYVLPIPPGVVVEEQEPFYATEIFGSPSGYEQRSSQMAEKRRRWRGRGIVRDDVAAPTPWSPYSELGALLFFQDQHKGAGSSFLFDDPTGRRNLLTYSQDFSQAIWAAYMGKPTITGGKTAPDGTATAQECASADYTTNYSGIERNDSAALGVPDGALAISIWARAVSGTLAATFGTVDSHTMGITLTTSWQRFTYLDSNWTYAFSSGRCFELYENVAGNQAWQVWGAQLTVGTAAGLYVPTGVAAETGRFRVRFDEDSFSARRVRHRWYAVDFELVSVLGES